MKKILMNKIKILNYDLLKQMQIDDLFKQKDQSDIQKPVPVKDVYVVNDERLHGGSK